MKNILILLISILFLDCKSIYNKNNFNIKAYIYPSDSLFKPIQFNELNINQFKYIVGDTNNMATTFLNLNEVKKIDSLIISSILNEKFDGSDTIKWLLKHNLFRENLKKHYLNFYRQHFYTILRRQAILYMFYTLNTKYNQINNEQWNLYINNSRSPPGRDIIKYTKDDRYIKFVVLYNLNTNKIQLQYLITCYNCYPEDW